MVLDTAKPKNRKSTILPGMHGRDAARKLTLKVDILQVFTNEFSEIHFFRESQLAIGWTEQKCKDMDELAKENHTYHLSPEEFKKTPRTIVPHLEQVRQKWVHATSTRFSSCALSKTVSTASQASKSQNPLLHNNTGDGILPQALHGGTSLNGIGGAHKKFLSDLFCYSWFRLQSVAIHCNRRVV